MPQFLKHIYNWLKNHKKIVTVCLSLVILIPVGLIVASYLIIEPYKADVTTIQAVPHTRVGIVLGAGINKRGKPFKELQARLDVAADAVNAGKVDKLILSGDNRFKNYNEPDAMVDYLVSTKHISKDKLQPDYAGRDTYASCERARKVFGQTNVIIFSAASHLPRAMYLCKHFGITSYGISSGVEANNSTRRELLARVKAVYNTHVMGEPTILGESISL